MYTIYIRVTEIEIGCYGVISALEKPNLV